MGQRILGTTPIRHEREHGRESHYFAAEGLDLRRLLDALLVNDSPSARSHDGHLTRISMAGVERRISPEHLRLTGPPESRQESLRHCALACLQAHCRPRNPLFVGIALFTYLGLLAICEIDTVPAVPLLPLAGFILGAVCGALTGLGLIVHRRWRLCVARRTSPVGRSMSARAVQGKRKCAK